MKKVLLITFILSIFFACNGQTNTSSQTTKSEQAQVEPTIQLLDVQTFKDGIVKPNIQLIDVRTPKEYEEGHIENAQLIDYFSTNFKETLKTLDKEKPLYLYCKSGGRSGKAAKILAELGFKEIYDLKGGYMAWKEQ